MKVEFRPHKMYQVDGRDVYLHLPVAPWEAALGATVKVPTPAGPVDLKIPPNSSGGRQLRLRGRGIPGKEPADTEAARKAYTQLEQKLKFNPRASLGV